MTRPLARIQRLHVLTGRQIAVARPRRGDTIRSFVARERLAEGLPTVVALRHRGELRPLMRRDWDRPIRRRDRLVLLSTPLGGGTGGGGTSGQIASIVGLVALLAIAGPLGGAAALAGLVGGGALATTIASALIIGGGSLLISHFLGAGRPKPDAPEYSINITSNQARSQQPVPCQYGRVKFFPDLASPIYTDYAGIKQVFHGLYSLGVGSFDIEEIGIGTQPIWHATGGTLPSFASLRLEQVEPGANCALFPINVYSAPEVSGQTLPDPYGTTYPDGSVSIGPNGEGQSNAGGPHPLGPFIAVPPGEVATDYAVDLIWPSGLYTTSSSGSQRSAECRIRLWYQAIDDQGHLVGNRVIAWTKTYTYNSKIPVRVTEKFSVPTAGRIQVEVGRLDRQGRSGYTDTVSWAGLKAYVQGPNAVPYASRLAIQLEADNLLSTYSSQQIYVIATRKVPVYDPGTGQFTVQATRNPIWAALDVWHNADYGGGLPLDHVDLATFATLAAGADQRGDAFNYRFTAQTTVLEAIETCLRPMLTTAVYLWDRLSAVRDEPRSFPALMLTDFEIIRGSLEIAYVLKDAQTSDGVILQYIDEDTWKSAEVTSREPGVTLLQPTRITQNGNTVRRQATDVARYHAAVNNYRRKTLTCQVEGEGRVARRGKLVTVQSELPQSWGQALRVEAIDAAGATITISAPADWSAAGAHYVRIRRPDGLPFGPVSCARGASDSQIVIAGSDLATVQAQQGLTWLAAATRGPLQEPASIELGVGTPMAFAGLVNRITRGDAENTFKLELVNDAPEVYGRSGAVDPLPVPSPLVLPVGPALLSGISARLEQTDAAIMLYASWNPDPVSVTYTAQVSFDSGATWPYVAYAEGELCSFQYGPMPAGNDCHLRIRGRSANNVTGPWAEVALESPDLDLSFLVPNQPVGYYDLPSETFDQAILTDELELAAMVETVNLRTLTTAAAVRAYFADYTQVATIVALSGTVDVNNKSLSASITSEAGIRLSQDQALATSITVVSASVDGASASIQQEAQTRSSSDGALALTINQLSASLTTANDNIAAESLTRQTAVADANNAIATLSTQLTSNYNSLSASLTSEQGTRASADSAFAGQLSTIQASADGASASGAISWQVVAGQSGYADAQYNLQLKAGVGDAKTLTGLFLEATDSDSRIVLTASKFQIQDAGTRTVPFAISGGNVYLQGVTKVSSTIQSQATTQSGQPVLAIDFINGALEIRDNS